MGAHFTVYNGKGLEFKGVFTSITLDLCMNFLKWIYSVENESQGGFYSTEAYDRIYKVVIDSQGNGSSN